MRGRIYYKFIGWLVILVIFVVDRVLRIVHPPVSEWLYGLVISILGGLSTVEGKKTKDEVKKKEDEHTKEKKNNSGVISILLSILSNLTKSKGL